MCAAKLPLSVVKGYLGLVKEGEGLWRAPVSTVRARPPHAAASMSGMMADGVANFGGLGRVLPNCQSWQDRRLKQNDKSSKYGSVL